MTRRQLAALFLCNLGPYIVGTSLLGLLPIYVTQFGANESIAGVYLSLAFAALAVGSLISGWLSDRFQRRKGMIVLSACLGLPATFLMGQVNSLVLLTLFTMIVWFVAGLSTGMVNILTGMYADEQTRGRTFGIIGLTLGLALIISGMTSGAIVDRWGFTTLFSLVGLAWGIQAIAALFLDDSRQSQRLDDPAGAQPAPLSMAIWLLIDAHLLASTTNFSKDLVRPLMMAELGFDATGITSVITINGIVALPLPLFIGWLSDRVGRSRLLMVGYLSTCLGAATLVTATGIGQIWVSSAIYALASAGSSLGFAYVTDLSTPATLGAAMSRFSATPWIAGIIGYGATGFIIQAVGLQNTLLVTAALPIISILLLFAINRQPRPAAAGLD